MLHGLGAALDNYFQSHTPLDMILYVVCLGLGFHWGRRSAKSIKK